MTPIFLGSFPATLCHFQISHFRPLKKGSPIEPDNLRIRGESRYFLGGGLGEKKTERRGENRHVACLHSHVYC